MLGNNQEAEDLTQEVFLTLWRHQNYEPKRGSMNAFLSTLTRSRAILLPRNYSFASST